MRRKDAGQHMVVQDVLGQGRGQGLWSLQPGIRPSRPPIGPQVASAPLHGGNCSHADQIPNGREQGGGGRLQEPELVAVREASRWACWSCARTAIATGQSQKECNLPSLLPRSGGRCREHGHTQCGRPSPGWHGPPTDRGFP
jgi:hypothetical protein